MKHHESQQQADAAMERARLLLERNKRKRKKRRKRKLPKTSSSPPSCRAVLGQGRRHPLRGAKAIPYGPDVFEDVLWCNTGKLDFLGDDLQCFPRAPGIRQSLVQCLRYLRYIGKLVLLGNDAAMRVVCCSFAAFFGLRPSGR